MPFLKGPSYWACRWLAVLVTDRRNAMYSSTKCRNTPFCSHLLASISNVGRREFSLSSTKKKLKTWSMNFCELSLRLTNPRNGSIGILQQCCLLQLGIHFMTAVLFSFDCTSYLKRISDSLKLNNISACLSI